MTNFEICKNVRNAVLNRAGEVMAYHKSWGDAFSVKEIAGVRDQLDKSKWFKAVDANDLSSAELDALGFGTWSDELPIRLIPIWLVPFLRDQIDAKCINGQSISSVKEMDNDTRFGCIAYGVIPKS